MRRAQAVSLVSVALLCGCAKQRNDAHPVDDDASRKKPANCKLPDDATIRADVLLTEGCVVEVTRDLSILKGAKLTLESGVRLSFAKGFALRVEPGGQLLARGTEKAPVVFGSAEKTPSPGDWMGLLLVGERITHPGITGILGAIAAEDAGAIPEVGTRPEGGVATLDRVVVEYAVDGIVLAGRGIRFSLTSSKVRKSVGIGVRADAEEPFVAFSGNALEDNGALSLEAPARALGSVSASTFTERAHTWGTIASSLTFPTLSVPIVVDNLVVETPPGLGPTRLTIPKGTVLEMTAIASIDVRAGSALVATDVRFTSSRAVKAAGDWSGLWFTENAPGTRIDRCVIEFAGRDYGPHGAIMLPADEKDFEVTNTTFRDDAGSAFEASSCAPWSASTKGNTSTGKTLCEPRPSAAPGPVHGAEGTMGDPLGTRFPTGIHPKTPRIRDVSLDVKGSYPSQVVRRVLRANYARFRLCYEKGLAKSPTLTGTVVVSFTIEKAGTVTAATLGKGTLTDPTVTSCIVSMYPTISYPETDSGTVSVTHTMAFDPGEP